MKVWSELVPVFGPYRDHHDMTLVRVDHPVIELRCPCGWSWRGIERDRPSGCTSVWHPYWKRRQ